MLSLPPFRHPREREARIGDPETTLMPQEFPGFPPARTSVREKLYNKNNRMSSLRAPLRAGQSNP